ncbi:MAG: hypothetical protein GY812_08565 [Actinomycetia bacterium]|nr:hypothetical protein [Actinomycetes bacterium]
MGVRRVPTSRWIRRGAVAALCAIGLSTLGTAVTAGAQQDDASGKVVRGGANAAADSMAFNIASAGASLGWTFGRSLAGYQDLTTTGEGRGVDLGALASLFALPQCDGELPPALDTDTLPELTVAESFGQGPQGPFESEVNLPQMAEDKSSPTALGTQSAQSTNDRAEGSTTTLTQDFGFFRVNDASSRAWVSFEDGVRTAHAVSRADRIEILGQVVFVDPVWSATAKSGAEELAEGSFTFRGASVYGNWLSGRALEQNLDLFKWINETFLGPLGLRISFPEVTTPEIGDGVTVTPLKVDLIDSPLAKDLLFPLLDTDLLETYREDSVSEDCRRETFWTVIDNLRYALGGRGALETHIGGVEVTTDDTDYSADQFVFGDGGEPGPPTEPVVLPPLQEPPPTVRDGFEFGDGSDDIGSFDEFDDFDSGDGDFSGGFDSGGDFEAGITEAGLSEQAPAEAEVAQEEPEDVVDSREVASGAQPDGSASNAAAVTLGILALLGAMGLSLGDRFMGIRAKHVIDEPGDS